VSNFATSVSSSKKYLCCLSQYYISDLWLKFIYCAVLT